MGRHGEISANSCRPIGNWIAGDVFAYLHKNQLPVHPAYAMTYGGARDRASLRVHPLCCAIPVLGKDTQLVDNSAWEQWEDRYYPDVIAAAHQARRHMWEDT